MSPTRFSRRPESHPLGKIDDRLDIPCPNAFKAKLTSIAAVHGQSAAEFARDALEKIVDGEWAFIQRRLRRWVPPSDGMNQG